MKARSLIHCKAMRIILTSDLHGNLPEIPECDLLIIAGDICPDFMYQRQNGNDVKFMDGSTKQAQWLNTIFRDWLAATPAKYVVGIAGNHDFVFQSAHHKVAPPLPWYYLEGEEVELDGLRIYGTPWVPNLTSWAFYGGHGGVDQAKLDAIPEGIDILVSHGPPQGYGDLIPIGSKYGRTNPVRVGCQNMNATLARVKPRVFVCGHIHEGFGHYCHPHVEEGIFNVAYVDEFYAARGVVEELNLEPRA
jgi:Icc-related predicted phosphoesterase